MDFSSTIQNWLVVWSMNFREHRCHTVERSDSHQPATMAIYRVGCRWSAVSDLGCFHYPLASKIFAGLRIPTAANRVVSMARHRACDCALWCRLRHRFNESSAALVNSADRIAWKIARPDRHGVECLSRTSQLESPVFDAN
jgi:hypothetical protein